MAYQQNSDFEDYFDNIPDDILPENSNLLHSSLSEKWWEEINADVSSSESQKIELWIERGTDSSSLPAAKSPSPPPAAPAAPMPPTSTLQTRPIAPAAPTPPTSQARPTSYTLPAVSQHNTWPATATAAAPVLATMPLPAPLTKPTSWQKQFTTFSIDTSQENAFHNWYAENDGAKVSKQNSAETTLFDFLLLLLHRKTARYKKLITWIDFEKKIFKGESFIYYHSTFGAQKRICI